MKRMIWVIAMALVVTSVGEAKPPRFEPCDQHSCSGSAACIDIGCLGGCDPYTFFIGFCASS